MAERRKPSVGISNRETPQQESEERAEHPPLGRTPPDDQSSPVSSEAEENAQTSGKSGSRSTAQKESESKYSGRGMPASSKTDGAFGRERGR
jgi:hypothetical protein